MPNPLSADIRSRFQKLFNEGLTGVRLAAAS